MSGKLLRIFRGESLRGRYLRVTAFLTLLAFSCIVLIHLYVGNEGVRLDRENGARNQATSELRLLRDQLLEVEKSLEAYMLSPSPVHHRHVDKALLESDKQRQRLAELSWPREARLSPVLEEFATLHGQLEESLQQLMLTRVDTERQFPILKLLRNEVFESNNAYLTAAGLMMTESEGPSREAFVEARTAWLELISQFRLYIINLLGTFFESDQQAQLQDLDMRFQAVVGRLAALHAMADNGELELEEEESLQQMEAAAGLWKKSFAHIRTIHELGDGHLRADVPFLKHTVEPHFNRLWDLLKKVDKALEADNKRAAAGQLELTQTIIQALWVMTLTGLAFLFLGYAYFEKSVLRPVAQVARALRAEAAGDSWMALPRADNEETRHLTEAFDEMQRQVQERQRALEFQALHDQLTGLPNRTLLSDRMQQAIFQSHRDESPLALLVLDLDRFKEINDTLGHALGDKLLMELGRRILDLLRQSDSVARLGSDEFAVLLPESDEQAALRVAAKIEHALEQPVRIDGHRLYLSCSIGIALYPQHADDPQGLSQRAEVAMNVAKSEHRDVVVYDHNYDHHSLRRLSLANDLRHMIDDHHLELLYQPQMTVDDERLVGVEALLRWNHPSNGLISPDEFIPVAERTGLIRPLGAWVLNRAMAQYRHWRDHGFDCGRMAVNLSVFNLQDPSLIAQLESLLEKWLMPPGLLELEITESAMMADPALAMKTLEQIHQLGITLSVDDFGTGFSSLAYLKQLPVNKLKIDKSFVLNMAEDADDATIVRSTVELAHNLGLKVVAEGVESARVMSMLRELNCDLAQGYYLGRPLAVDELEPHLTHFDNAKVTPIR